MTKTGFFIRMSRKRENKSQVYLAKALKCSSQFVANWERGVSWPPANYLKIICKELKIKKEEIIEVMAEDYKDQLLKNF